MSIEFDQAPTGSLWYFRNKPLPFASQTREVLYKNPNYDKKGIGKQYFLFSTKSHITKLSIHAELGDTGEFFKVLAACDDTGRSLVGYLKGYDSRRLIPLKNEP